ncbi:poly(ADP-ribose) glycohydrolase-like [Venturia canescens]|uniref:poly(ADP-ribose) glycohydrolase-like n=1 Tax=Venturia canescens TaxID=32260 RepID=UPI001C9D4E40|nr:poly(ADP-ribose) glycohydrolase-like [Venturia canescens]
MDKTQTHILSLLIILGCLILVAIFRFYVLTLYLDGFVRPKYRHRSKVAKTLREAKTDDTPNEDWLHWKAINEGMGWNRFEENPPIAHSANHTVLFELSKTDRDEPKIYFPRNEDRWDHYHIRMPHSMHNVYKIKRADGIIERRPRWPLIQENLRRDFDSITQFEEAVSSYYHRNLKFTALHYLLKISKKEETDYFFKKLLPNIVDLALQLPELVTVPIPVLMKNIHHSVSLSQLQVASLLANAFLCTFPKCQLKHTNPEYALYPSINFVRLFSAGYDEKCRTGFKCVMEKLKFILHYFERVTTKHPEGKITIERRFLLEEFCPNWSKQDATLPPVKIMHSGTPAVEGANMLQVYFANKFMGGDVLGCCCVDEEMKFLLYPELLVTMLLTEVLGGSEALVVSGIERYSEYKGSEETVTWAGDYVDETLRDSYGRRETFLVGIDALNFRAAPNAQFETKHILRELNKAYVGFRGEIRKNLPPIATRNWGGGALKGNPKLKFLIQWMAATVAERSMFYFTLGDQELTDKVTAVYQYVVQQKMDVAKLFSVLTKNPKDYKQRSEHSEFYLFVYQNVESVETCCGKDEDDCTADLV